jgi:hypothetical protein
MNYLEEEIDEALNTLKIERKKIVKREIDQLIKSLTKKYFKTESTILDAMEFNETETEHNPSFWQEIENRVKKPDLILLVFDTDYRAWIINNSQDLEPLIGETTGYLFWLIDRNLTFLLHLDHHDCIISA